MLALPPSLTTHGFVLCSPVLGSASTPPPGGEQRVLRSGGHISCLSSDPLGSSLPSPIMRSWHLPSRLWWSLESFLSFVIPGIRTVLLKRKEKGSAVHSFSQKATNSTSRVRYSVPGYLGWSLHLGHSQHGGVLVPRKTAGSWTPPQGSLASLAPSSIFIRGRRSLPRSSERLRSR